MDPKSAFIKQFGDLIALLRADPANQAAQESALAAAAAAVARQGLEVEAGVEWSSIPDDLTLKGRLLARGVETVRLAAGAEPQALLRLARALAHDGVPIPSTARVRVEMVSFMWLNPATSVEDGGVAPRTARNRDPQSPDRRRWEERRGAGRLRWDDLERRRTPDRRLSGERRLELINDQRAEIAKLHDGLRRGARHMAWEAMLHSASMLVRLQPRVPVGERRSFGIQVRRDIPARAIEALVDLAERDPTGRDRAADVLRWIGLDAAEVILERLRQSEAIGVRGFYYDVLGGMPETYPLIRPLLHSHYTHEIRHAAVLAGRLGRPEAVDELLPLLGHRDERVRAAAVGALGELHRGSAAAGLQQALHHRDPKTRAAAADAIAVWRGGALALLLVSTLETERDWDAWQAMVSALGRLGTLDACQALATVALTRRTLLRRRGYTTGQRLAAVTALGLATTEVARTTLERLAREGGGVVRYAADRLLHGGRQRAG